MKKELIKLPRMVVLGLGFEYRQEARILHFSFWKYHFMLSWPRSPALKVAK